MKRNHFPKIDALVDTMTHPLGTARLVIGASTLRRADAAGVTLDQMRKTFDDLERHSDAALRGFLDISRGLMDGTIRISNNALGDAEDDDPLLA